MLAGRGSAELYNLSLGSLREARRLQVTRDLESHGIVLADDRNTEPTFSDNLTVSLERTWVQTELIK